MKQLSIEQQEARAKAYKEAAEYLKWEWTQDPLEREEGLKVARALEFQSIVYDSRASNRRNAAAILERAEPEAKTEQ